MLRTAIAAAFGLALVAGPALADPLPETLAVEIQTLMPDVELEGRDFTQAEIDELMLVMSSNDSALDKQTRVQQILDAQTTMDGG